MRRTLCLLTFFAAFGVGDRVGAESILAELAAGRPPEAPAECCPADAFVPRWTVTFDGLALTRGTASERVLAMAGNPGLEALNVRDLQFNWWLNPRLTATRHGARWDVEFIYFQVDNWQAHGRVADATQLTFTAPNFVTSVLGPGAFDFHYASRLHNTELNFRRPLADTITFVTGLRWIELHEQFTGSIVSGAPLGDFWSSNVDNHLVGWQIGVDAAVWDFGGRFRVDARLRAGIFSNAADQDSASPMVNTPGVSARTTHAAGVGGLDLVATYRLTDRIALRGGYQVLWLDGVALGPNQIGSSDITSGIATVDTSGTLFSHGALFGLEARF